MLKAAVDRGSTEDSAHGIASGSVDHHADVSGCYEHQRLIKPEKNVTKYNADEITLN
jgi:hypothetical protein